MICKYRECVYIKSAWQRPAIFLFSAAILAASAARGLSRSGWSRLLDSDARRGNSPRKGFFHRCSMRFTTVSDAEKKGGGMGCQTISRSNSNMSLSKSEHFFLFLLKRFRLGTAAPIWMSQLKPSCWKSRCIFKKLIERLVESPHLPTYMSCNKTIGFADVKFRRALCGGNHTNPYDFGRTQVWQRRFSEDTWVSEWKAMSSWFPTKSTHHTLHHGMALPLGPMRHAWHALCMTCANGDEKDTWYLRIAQRNTTRW